MIRSEMRAGFFVLFLVSSDAAQVCQVDKDGMQKCEGGLGPAKCLGFRQTGGCSPDGPREPHGDKPCSHTVEPGASGFCECDMMGNRVQVRYSSCNHRPFTCDNACVEHERYSCVSWRQTSGCSAEGERETNNDKPCNARIDAGASGYCECGAGRTIKKPGCDKGKEFNEEFTCENECSAEPDLYEELELDSSAEESDIKKAFRKLSVKYHPDKTRSKPELSARFPAIREAYDVLSNLEHRAVYDMGGFQMVREAQQNKLQKGPSMNGEIKVTLESMYNGLEQRTAIQRKTICRYCREKNTPRCNLCNVQCAHEKQLVNVQMGPFVMQQEQAVASKEKCKHTTTNLPVQVERGMAEGDQLTFAGMGEQQPKSVPGDVILTLKMADHPLFKRAGNDLRMNMRISLKEALLGWKRTIKHLDQREITIEISGITSPMETIKVENEGMPYRGDPTSKGHLYIKCYIDMPKEGGLQENHKEWLRANFPD